MKKILIMLILPFFAACEQALFEEDMASDNPIVNFDYLWNQINDKYAYFELKNIDWESSRLKYRSKINDHTNDEELFAVMGEMLTELKDGHTNLISHFNNSFFGVEQQGPDNFDWRIVKDLYLPTNYYITGPFQHDFIANEEIGYVRFEAFSGFIEDKYFDFVLNRYQHTKGIILDIRENPGGDGEDIFELLERFIDSKTTIYYSRIKNGKGKTDFSSPTAVDLEPYSGIRYSKPVMLLTDRGTYSAGSFTSLGAKAIPSITQIGDTTGGGLGMPNGGQLPNGWRYRFSISQALTTDLDASFENGVPPDILVYSNPMDLSKDEVIDRAILEILK
jgi:C-terminal processing protease CtpA/Prc